MLRRLVVTILSATAFAAALPAAGQLNLYCSSPNTAWCQGMANGFEKATGIKAAVVQKATGEMLAQVKAERANPKGDIWWAGPGDAYLQAAEDGLLETYLSPNVRDLHDWAQRITVVSQSRVSGVYGGILSLGYNTELQAKKKLPVPKCWKDLLEPAYKNEVMLGNPNSSGTAYLMLASLVQVFGEDEAFKYMKALNANVSSYARSGIGPMTAVKQGEIYVGSTVLHGVINEIVAGFPVKPVLPCEGVGLRNRVDGDHQGRAQSRQREAIRRLGAHRGGAEDRSRGQGVCDPDQQERAAAADGAQPDRIQGHQLRFREVRFERDPEAPPRALGEGDRPSAAMTDTRRAERFWLAVGAIGFLFVPWYALQDSVFALGWIAQFTTKEAAPALLQVAPPRQGLARAARPRSRRGRGAREPDPRARRARDGADRPRRDRLRLPFRPGLRHRSPGMVFRVADARRCRRCRAGNTAWDWAPRSSPRRAACCSRWDSPAAATSRAIRSSPRA